MELYDVLTASQAPLYADGEQMKQRVASASERGTFLCDTFSQTGLKVKHQNFCSYAHYLSNLPFIFWTTRFTCASSGSYNSKYCVGVLSISHFAKHRCMLCSLLIFTFFLLIPLKTQSDGNYILYYDICYCCLLFAWCVCSHLFFLWKFLTWKDRSYILWYLVLLHLWL